MESKAEKDNLTKARSVTTDGETAKNRTFWYAVLASVLASLIFVIILQPLLGLLWRAFADAGGSLGKVISSHIYRNAALGQRDWVAAILAQIAFGCLTGIMFGILSIRLFGRRIAIHALERSQSNHLLHQGKFRKVLRVTLPVIGTLIVLLTFGFVSSMIVYDLQLNTSFQQRLTVLRPKISELEEHEIKASWAMMRCRTDYEAINSRMEEWAAKRGVKLPDLLLR